MDFSNLHTIAVVGLSSDPTKPSYEVASYLQKNGFKVVPVNPKETEILGEKSYPDLLSIPKDLSVDVVDIFRRPDQVIPIVEQAIALKPKIIWMQKGVVNEDAKKIGEASGIEVIMDKCIKTEHSKNR